jgi:hypothetical protein
MRGEIAESYLDVIARSEATKQSSFFVGVATDCFAALAMTFNPTVMPGLDPGIHRSSRGRFSKQMDCRVKPGNDEVSYAVAV